MTNHEDKIFGSKSANLVVFVDGAEHTLKVRGLLLPGNFVKGVFYHRALIVVGWLTFGFVF